MNEDIIRMAKQAGGRESGSPELYDCFIMSLDDLKRFAALVAAAEREACARVCDDKAKQTFSGRCAAWGNYVARVIRARGITQDQPLPEDQNPSF